MKQITEDEARLGDLAHDTHTEPTPCFLGFELVMLWDDHLIDGPMYDQLWFPGTDLLAGALNLLEPA